MEDFSQLIGVIETELCLLVSVLRFDSQKDTFHWIYRKLRPIETKYFTALLKTKWIVFLYYLPIFWKKLWDRSLRLLIKLLMSQINHFQSDKTASACKARKAHNYGGLSSFPVEVGICSTPKVFTFGWCCCSLGIRWTIWTMYSCFHPKKN